MAIAIKNLGCNCRRAYARAKVYTLEKCAAPVAEQHGNAVRAPIRYRQVRFAVAVEVAVDKRRRTPAYESIDFIRERAVAIAEKNGNQSIRLVQYRQVQFPGVSEIARDDGYRTVDA